MSESIEAPEFNVKYLAIDGTVWVTAKAYNRLRGRLTEAKRLLEKCLRPPYADDLRLLIVGIGGSSKSAEACFEIAEALRARQDAIRAFLTSEGRELAGEQ